MRLVIDRARWLRGTGNGMLLNAKGKMCCLGFFCKALNIPDEILLNVGLPDGITDEKTRDILDTQAPWLTCDDELRLGSGTCANLVDTNDYVISLEERARAVEEEEEILVWSEEQREAHIQRLFAEHGVMVEFTD